jgi:uncharacterized SAM-binding protein YcdF (DUF218 family)
MGARGRPSVARRRREPRGCGRLLVQALLVLFALYLLLRLAGPWLLESYARWLVVDDPMRRSDAVVALSGGDGERLHAAIQLYRKGLAGALLIVGPDVPLLKVYSGEDSLTQGEAKRRIAIRKGIPADSIILALGSTSTIEEARVTLAEARVRHWRSVLIVTDPFHTRRARATFHRVFHGSEIALVMYHLPESRSAQKIPRWWTRESDSMAVFTETVKMIFYAANHRVWPWG